MRSPITSDYLAALHRRKFLIASAALAVLAASFVSIKRIPNVYESSTFIIVESASNVDGAPETAHLDLQRRLTTIKEQVTSRSRLDTLIGKHNLYPDLTAPGVTNDRAIARMQGDIDVDVRSSRPDATESFRISYRAADPETACRVTADLAAQLIADNITAVQDLVSSQAAVLRQRASEVSAQLKGLEQKAPWLISLREDAPISVGGGSRGSAQATRQQQMAVETLRDQQYKSQQQIADLNRRIAEQAQIVDRQNNSQAPGDNPTVGALVAKRAELQGQRDNLINKQGLTEKHPRVAIVDDQISSINKTLVELNRQNQGSAHQTAEERELRSLEMERNRLKIDYELSGREVARRTASPLAVANSGNDSTTPRSASAARLSQDYLSLKQSYKELSAKLHEVELALHTVESSRLGQFKILDEANLPQAAIWPNRRLLGVVGLVLSIIVGLGCGFLAEVRSLGSFRTSQDVEFYTRLPLLGAIPRTLTPAERTAARTRTRLRITAVVAASALCSLLLAQVFTVLRVFEMIVKK